MGRIQKVYENNFRAMLGAVRARQFDRAVRWFRHRAELLSMETGLPLERSAAEVYERSRRRLRGARARRPSGRGSLNEPGTNPPRFFCDAGLGGLARWLRAAGYEADWKSDINDDALLEEARGRRALLLTTDSLLMERRVLREGIIPSLWLSPALKTGEQLQVVLRELALPLRDPRCMACGGRLVAVPKEEMHERIPPKTYHWLDEFFACELCGKLFWHGTHWERIQARLCQAACA